MNASGEWVSWDYINRQLHEQDRIAQFPHANQQIIEVFDNLVDVAMDKRVTGRYLPLFGELGELYAEIKYGIRRHKPRTEGSDGKLGNDFVEVKTISPENERKKSGSSVPETSNKVVVVKISADFEFETRMIDRRALSKSFGKFISTSWQLINR